MVKEFFALMLVLSALCMEGFGQERLEGLWQLDIDKSLQLVDPVTKERYDSLGSERQVHMRSAMSGRTFHFQADGTLRVAWKSGEQQRESLGGWVLGSDPGTVKITIDNKPRIFDYSFSEGFLRLKHRGAAGFFSTLCFSRQ